MSEISDEFKVVVVGAIAALCQKYPRKHAVMMNYLSSMLRDEVGRIRRNVQFSMAKNIDVCFGASFLLGSNTKEGDICLAPAVICSLY